MTRTVADLGCPVNRPISPTGATGSDRTDLRILAIVNSEGATQQNGKIITGIGDLAYGLSRLGGAKFTALEDESGTLRRQFAEHLDFGDDFQESLRLVDTHSAIAIGRFRLVRVPNMPAWLFPNMPAWLFPNMMAGQVGVNLNFPSSRPPPGAAPRVDIIMGEPYFCHLPVDFPSFRPYPYPPIQVFPNKKAWYVRFRNN